MTNIILQIHITIYTFEAVYISYRISGQYIILLGDVRSFLDVGSPVAYMRFKLLSICNSSKIFEIVKKYYKKNNVQKKKQKT